MRKFKGQPRTLGDTSKPKPAPTLKRGEEQPRPIEMAEPTTPSPPPPEVIEPLPGPDDRRVVVTRRRAGTPAPKRNDPNVDYNLRASDLKGQRVGVYQPKTFADVRKGERELPRKAVVRFEVNANEEIVTIEAQFAANEFVMALFAFLDNCVFQTHIEYTLVIPPNERINPQPNRTLAAMRLLGNVAIRVNCSEPPVLLV